MQCFVQSYYVVFWNDKLVKFGTESDLASFIAQHLEESKEYEIKAVSSLEALQSALKKNELHTQAVNLEDELDQKLVEVLDTIQSKLKELGLNKEGVEKARQQVADLVESAQVLGKNALTSVGEVLGQVSEYLKNSGKNES